MFSKGTRNCFQHQPFHGCFLLWWLIKEICDWVNEKAVIIYEKQQKWIYFNNHFQSDISIFLCLLYNWYFAQKIKFSIKNFFSKCDQILNGKLHFLCSDMCELYEPSPFIIVQRFSLKIRKILRKTPELELFLKYNLFYKNQ